MNECKCHGQQMEGFRGAVQQTVATSYCIATLMSILLSHLPFLSSAVP